MWELVEECRGVSILESSESAFQQVLGRDRQMPRSAMMGAAQEVGARTLGDMGGVSGEIGA